MKKVITVLLAAAMSLSLAACGSGSINNSTPSSSTQDENATSPVETMPTAEQGTLASVDGRTYNPEDKIIVGYTAIETEAVAVGELINIKVLGYEIFRDYNDVLSICLTLEVENKTNDTFEFSPNTYNPHTRVYQNGVENGQVTAYGVETIWTSRSGDSVNIRSGAVANRVFAFSALEDIESAVEVEFFMQASESTSDTICFELN